MVDAVEPSAPMTGPETLASRVRWQLELVRVLEGRGERFPTARRNCGRCWPSPVDTGPERLVDHVEANRTLTIDLLADIANTLDDAQRKRVRTRAATLAADFEALACPPSRAVADAG